VRLFTRADDFKSSKSLWIATQKTAPVSSRIYNNLGDVYSKEQNWDLAVANFKMSVALAPDYADAIHNLGYTYMLMGDYENAKKYLLESYQKNGRLWQALEKLGRIELKEGNREKAAGYFEGAHKINPGFVAPTVNP
jgi:tetratricopeptide (TPR) repeat protein